MLADAPFEAGGLDGWTAGTAEATATLRCYGAAIEGACDAEISG